MRMCFWVLAASLAATGGVSAKSVISVKSEMPVLKAVQNAEVSGEQQKRDGSNCHRKKEQPSA